MTSKTRLLLFCLLCTLSLSLALPLAAQDDSPVAQDGPYQFGVRIEEITDESRDRTLEMTIFYPALVSDDAPRPYPPNDSGAPYPLIIYSHGYTSSPGESIRVFNRLVSQGFVVAGVNHRDTRDAARALVDRPLDVLFLLNTLTGLGENDPLAGLIDTEKVGVMGYSFGGYTSLTGGGARIDPLYLADWCTEHAGEPIANYCYMVPDWDALNTYRDQFLAPSDDDLWPPMTDDRIDAVFAIAPCFGQYFGENGSAAASAPAFIVAGTTDLTCLYDIDSAYYYAHLGSPDRYLLSLEGRSHGAVIGETALLQQYATAFFGYYLQGKSDYAQYLTPDSAEAFRDATLDTNLEADS